MYKYAWVLFFAGCGGSTPDPVTKTPKPERILAGPFTGIRVAASPDLTGDGAPDVIISSPGVQDDNGVFLFSGALSGEYAQDEATTSILASEDGEVGGDVAPCGDMDGDGIADLLIGAPNTIDRKGGAWLLHGPVEGEIPTDSIPDFSPGMILDALTGYTLNCSADVDGDGLFDMAMAAPDGDGFGIATMAGQVYFLQGTADGPESIANFSTTFTDSQLGFEQSLILEDDVSGDGIPDAIIGAHGISRVHMIFGPLAGSYDANTAGPEFTGEATSGDGHALSTGDLDNDGYADVAIGGPFHGFDHGWVSVISGPFEDNQQDPIEEIASVIVEGQDPHELTGWSVAITDDIDGDGNKDLLIGAPGAVTSGPEAGVVYLVYGPGTATDTTLKADVTFLGNVPYAHFGHSVTDVPDIDGDGGAEVLLGAPFLDTEDVVGAGGAFLFYSGMPARPEANQADATFIF